MKCTIKDICSIKSGKRLPKGAIFSDEITPYPYIRARDIKAGRIYVDELAFLTEEVQKRIAQYIVNTNDVVITIVGASVGDVGFVTPELNGFNLTENAVRLTGFSKCVNPRYLLYVLNSKKYWELMQQIAGGSAQPKLGIYKIESIPLELPSIEKQNSIVELLSTYDNLIENNQKQIKLLEEAAQRLYKEWFVDLRFPGHEDMQIVDGVPEGWKIVSLDDVISKITTGLNPRKNFVLGKGNNFYVTIKNMGDNNIYLDDKCDKIDNEALEKINKRSDLRTGDILFSGIGTMGRVYLISIPTNNWNVSESVFTMRANERITNEYLYMVLLSDDMKSYCDQNAHGVAQRGIRMADLRAYKLLLPDDNILKKYTYISKPLIQKVQALQKQCKELTEARDRLLPKLMSGEIEL